MLGTSIGPYRVIRKLGAGGMGEVYLAEDSRLDRRVALKIVSTTSMASSDARSALMREARAAAKLSHPNIAAVYDVIDHGERLHIVMEFVEGETAAALARQGPLPVEQVVDIGIQLMDALVDAHARGIIHRDLKPGNIMVTPGGRVKVLDFGLAKVWDPAGREVSRETGTIVEVGGTPPYMAPERLLRRTSDHRADLYASGALLYELLTGRLPFDATDCAGLAVATATSVPRPPHTLNPDVPPALSDIVLRALNRDAAVRHASAAELRHDLERTAMTLAERETGVAPPRPMLPTSIRHITRKPVAKRIGAAAAIALTAAIVWFGWSLASPRSPAPAFRERDWVLIADFENRTGEPLFDDTLRATFEAALQQSRYVNIVPRTQVFDALARMRRKDLARVDQTTAIEIGKRENIPVILAGSAFAAGATFQIAVTALDAASDQVLFVVTEQFRRREELFDRVDALALEVRERLGEVLRGLGQQTQPTAKVTTTSLEALQLYSRALDSIAKGGIVEGRSLLEAALVRDPEFAMAHVRLGTIYSNLGQLNKTVEHYERAYALRDRVSEREGHAIESNYYTARDDYAKAAESWRALTRLYPDDVTARFELANALYEEGQLEAAVPELRHTLRLNPFHGSAYHRLILMLARMDRPDEAIAAYEEAASRGIETPYLQWSLGLARLGKNDTGEARRIFDRLIQLGEPYRSIGALYLAQVDSYEGKLAAARSRLEADIVLDEKSQNVANALLRRYHLGRIFLLQGNATRAGDQARAILGAGEPNLFGENLYQAGTLLVRARQLPLARRVLNQLKERATRMPTTFHRTLAVLLEAELALAERQLDASLKSFDAAAGGYPRYELLEGVARLHTARSESVLARQGWERVIAARGQILQVGFAADWPLAELELARACRQAGAVECARTRYEAFLEGWKGADDLAVRREAVDEFRQIVRDPRPAR